jgi:hypothetical protein
MRMRAAMIGVAIAVLAGCTSNGSLAPPPSAAVVGSGENSVILTDEPERWRHDAYELVSARVEGDTLHVAVQYSGGCTSHEFALLVTPIFMESYPVQMAGSLAHDARADPCRALVGSRLAFDLSPIKTLYRQAYGVQSDTVHLNIRGWPDRVVYSF